jgi:hypothetical protein
MPIPSPSEAPDLYDDFDYPVRPPGYKTGVRRSERVQQLIDEEIKDQNPPKEDQ